MKNKSIKIEEIASCIVRVPNKTKLWVYLGLCYLIKKEAQIYSASSKLLGKSFPDNPPFVQKSPFADSEQKMKLKIHEVTLEEKVVTGDQIAKVYDQCKMVARNEGAILSGVHGLVAALITAPEFLPEGIVFSFYERDYLSLYYGKKGVTHDGVVVNFIESKKQKKIIRPELLKRGDIIPEKNKRVYFITYT